MPWLFLGALLLFASILLVQTFISASPETLAKVLRRVGAVLLTLLSLPLLWRGNLALGIPMLGMAAVLMGWRSPINLGSLGRSGRSHKSSGQHSNIETRTLRMTLDHDSGAMEGEVLQGSFAGHKLSALPIESLMQIFRECSQNDPDGAALLQSYIERHRAEELNGSWQSAGEGAGAEQSRAQGAMTKEEAYAVLGLRSGASREAIIQAHKQLMMKVHPDQGGSNYLASKINQAKDVLLVK